MLRARAWKDRGHPFVCAFCRLNISAPRTPTASCQSSTSSSSSPWSAARSLSTTAPRHESSSSNGAPPRTGGFPSAFPGPGGGTWGTFASGVNRPSTTTTSPTISDGLLPHEREARQRSAAAAAAAETAPQSNKKNQQPQEKKDDQNKRRPNQAQANLSRSVLADVFKTNREPRPPPTPKSWSSAHQDAAEGGSKSANDAAQPSGGPSTTSSAGTGLQGSGIKDEEASKTAAGGKHKSTGWGSFSHRKSEITTHGPDTRGNESTVWSEITKSKRAKAKPIAGGGKLHSHKHAANPSTLQQDQDVPTKDFWGELETRATSFRDRSKNKKESSKAKLSTSSDKDQDGSQNFGESTSPTQKSRRKSRFEMEEEQETADDRRSKKSKKPQRNQRAAEDDDWDDEAVHRWEQKQRRKAEKEALKQKAAEEEQQATPIFLPEYISASNLARALKQRVDSFLNDMEEMGFENVTSDTIFTGETAALVAMEYGFEPTVDSGSLRDLRPRAIPEDVSSLPSRPPVVTIMGHVDHGKTTLLDWLRKSSVAAQEHGGITQHIGAFVVKMSSGKSITFLDTPGHAAFLSMRQRGANVTDIVVLVVAADDSVMPQTIEALKHATTAKVPIIVAITKVDKEDARIDQVKADLSRHGVEIEDYGGDVQVVCVSGKTGQGMDDLEENIVTLSEILDVRAEDDCMAEGWVLESSIKAQGKAATVLVKRGTLRPGDFIVAGKTWARIRVLRNEAGVDLAEAPPGTPVEILGWRDLPTAGEQVLQSPDEGRAKTAVEYRLEMTEREQSSIQLAEQEQRQRDKAAAAAAAAEAATEDRVGAAAGDSAADAGIIVQNFTVKADVVGSVEAVCGTILELGNHEVQPKILRSSAGQITEYDIDHAATSNSVIVNFNCAIQPHIKQRAEEAKVRILDHNVIYHVVDDVRAALSKLLPMNISFRVSGEADVLQVFPINVKRRVYTNIAGCRVRNGSIKKSSRVKILRRGEVIYDGKIDTLKHVKKDVQEMGKGSECGIGLEGFDDFQVDDQIQTYEEIREKRHL